MTSTTPSEPAEGPTEQPAALADYDPLPEEQADQVVELPGLEGGPEGVSEPDDTSAGSAEPDEEMQPDDPALDPSPS